MNQINLNSTWDIYPFTFLDHIFWNFHENKWLKSSWNNRNRLFNFQVNFYALILKIECSNFLGTLEMFFYIKRHVTLNFFTLFKFGSKQSAINSNCCNPQATLVRPLGGPMLPTTLSIPKYFFKSWENAMCISFIFCGIPCSRKNVEPLTYSPI